MCCDQHVRKMILESCQMLVTARVMAGELPAGTRYTTLRMKNHPCAVWVREGGLGWLERHMLGLCAEYEHRFSGVAHATYRFYFEEVGALFAPVAVGLAQPLCVSVERDEGDAVGTYRRYYVQEKARFASWTRRAPPRWFTEGLADAGRAHTGETR
jgi:hypothetical protein